MSIAHTSFGRVIAVRSGYGYILCPGSAASCADGDRAPLSPSAASASSHDGGRSGTPRLGGLSTADFREELQMQSVETQHGRHVGFARQVVDAAAGDVQSFRLLGDRQIVCAVIIVLRSAARLADAPSKKLFSSPPIFALSDFISMVAGAAPLPPPRLKTSAS